MCAWNSLWVWWCCQHCMNAHTSCQGYDHFVFLYFTFFWSYPALRCYSWNYIFETTAQWLTRPLLHVLSSTFNLPMSTSHFVRNVLQTIVNLLLCCPEAVLFTSHISKCCGKHTVGGHRDKTTIKHPVFTYKCCVVSCWSDAFIF